MRIFARRTIPDFCERHPAAKQQALAWHDEVAKATWANPQDIKNRYASASFVGGNRAVFNLKGCDYRLIVAIAYRIGAVSIKFIGPANRVYEVLSGTRPLSLAMIRRLHEGLRIPAEVLIGAA